MATNPTRNIPFRALRSIGRSSPFLLAGLVGLATFGSDVNAYQRRARGDGVYDTLIVPGSRIGPVSMGGSVSEIVRHLGAPDRSQRDNFRGPGYTSDSVVYTYRNPICLRFSWFDSGLDPRVAYGFWGINATCDRWRTAEGLHVGSSIQEVVAALGPPTETSNCDGREECYLSYNSRGIIFRTRDRNTPIQTISVVSARN